MTNLPKKISFRMLFLTFWYGCKVRNLFAVITAENLNLRHQPKSHTALPRSDIPHFECLVVRSADNLFIVHLKMFVIKLHLGYGTFFKTCLPDFRSGWIFESQVKTENCSRWPSVTSYHLPFMLLSLSYQLVKNVYNYFKSKYSECRFMLQ